MGPGPNPRTQLHSSPQPLVKGPLRASPSTSQKQPNPPSVNVIFVFKVSLDGPGIVSAGPSFLASSPSPDGGDSVPYGPDRPPMRTHPRVAEIARASHSMFCKWQRLETDRRRWLRERDVAIGDISESGPSAREGVWFRLDISHSTTRECLFPGGSGRIVVSRLPGREEEWDFEKISVFLFLSHIYGIGGLLGTERSPAREKGVCSLAFSSYFSLSFLFSWRDKVAVDIVDGRFIMP